jgi:hypothetical protein
MLLVMVRKTTKPLRALRNTKLEVPISIVLLSVLRASVVNLSNKAQPLAKYQVGKVFQGFNAEAQRIREERKGVSLCLPADRLLLNNSHSHSPSHSPLFFNHNGHKENTRFTRAADFAASSGKLCAFFVHLSVINN